MGITTTKRIANYLRQAGKGTVAENYGKSALTPKQRKRVAKKANAVLGGKK